MNVFSRKPKQVQELEHALRENRPEPPDAFLDELVVKASTAPVSRRHPRSRVGLSLAFGLVTVVGFAAFGGLGYAKSTVTDTVASTTSAISNVVSSQPNSTAGANTSTSSTKQNAGGAQYANKVLICHRPPGKNKEPITLSVSQSALGGHLGHGDTVGACGTT